MLQKHNKYSNNSTNRGMGDNNCKGILETRRRLNNLNIPPSRFSLVSPYPQYTEDQLNMRRKAEVLQYRGNQQNTKTNSLTKAERWAQLVNGNYQSRYISQHAVAALTPQNNSSLVCPYDEIIATPTSSSDVPGPVVYLHLDPAVPLYNYSSGNIRSYSEFNQTNVQPWNLYVQNNLAITTDQTSRFGTTNNIITTDISNTAFTIAIRNIDQTSYIFSIVMPLAIYIDGFGSNYATNTSAKTMSVSITNVFLTVFYNGSPISPRSDYVYSPPTNLSSIAIDPTSIPKMTPFNALQFIGNLTISNINLLTQQGYVYDFSLKFTLSITNTSFNTISSASVLCNYSALSNASQQTNCIITSTPSTDVIQPLDFMGV